MNALSRCYPKNKKKSTPALVPLQMQVSKIRGKKSLTPIFVSSSDEDTPDSWSNNELLSNNLSRPSFQNYQKTNTSSKTSINKFQTLPFSSSENLFNNNSNKILILITHPIILITADWCKTALVVFADQKIYSENLTAKMAANRKIVV